jgi:hypothetical protein
MDKRTDNQPDASLPDALVGDLRRLYEPTTPVDRERDRQILAAAGQILAETSPSKRRIPTWASLAAAAAVAAMIGVNLFLPSSPSSIDPILTATTQHPDLDGNGTIDILDAFALAREVEAGHNLEHLDMNHDGQVDQADIDRIAQQAVALREGS